MSSNEELVKVFTEALGELAPDGLALKQGLDHARLESCKLS